MRDKIVIGQASFGPTADGFYIVTEGAHGWQWRGAGRDNTPFPTRKAAKQAANTDGLPRPWYIGTSTGGIMTFVKGSGDA
jgi:hypothetical protein